MKARQTVLSRVERTNKHNLLLLRKNRDKEEVRGKNVRHNERGASTVSLQQALPPAVSNTL